MKILHTVQFYHPRVGGSELLIKDLSEALVQRGHEVTVATAFDPTRSFEILHGVTVASFRVAGNSVFGIQGPDKQKYVEFVKNGPWDLMLNYAAQIWSSDLLFPHLGELPFHKVIVPCGYSALRTAKMRVVYWNYFRTLPGYLRQYDGIVYHTAIGLDKLYGDRNAVNTNHVVIPNGVPSSNTNSVSFRTTYNVTTPLFLLSVGNHFRAKGHFELIEVMKRLNREDVTLVIIGEGESECALDCARAAELSRGQIRVLHNVPRDFVLAAYREADLFVFTSRVEYFPLVILESMAAGTPFVSTEVGNVKELKGGLVGRTVDDITHLVKRLLFSSCERTKLGEEGFDDWLKHYQWTAIVDSYEGFYKRIVGR